ncbi:unnamed protein product [Didymodactylos carnosus]|uniref:Uncharacterized protein n=1 Tax=Didymodactylos carnosus TaxID=1234261 RepID=A0A8S2SXX6_9BILA|nr:unnamed protein product [Didymodactylos carnosus]CAF4250386.1 unnamed protein product [Didymodactylos carnosus]
MEVNLDLDNFDKIEHTYKIVSEINAMKPIEKIITSVGSHIDAVNSCNDTNKEDIFETARMLLSRLQEVSELKTKYLCVFSCISNQKIFDEWQKELSRYLVELSDKMENLSVTQKIEALNTKLLIVKALSRLDGFLEGEKYIDVYHDIKNTDYVQVASGMVALQSSNEVGKHFHEQAKRAPGVGLDSMMKETKSQAIMLGNNIEIERITSIVGNLEEM